MLDLGDMFSFEFHSLLPVSVCKTINEAENSTTLKLFGRTKNFASVCANVVAHLPYFYLGHSAENNLESPFLHVQEFSSIGISFSSFKISNVDKVPLYNYYEGQQKFLKVECCSESVRKRLINFIKDSPNLYYTLYEVSRIRLALTIMILVTCIFHTSIHV